MSNPIYQIVVIDGLAGSRNDRRGPLVMGL